MCIFVNNRKVDLQWHKGEGSYLHLYRLTPGQSFEFDWEIMYNSSTGAKKERDSCLHPESALCAPCFDNEHHKVTVESILRPSEGSSSAYYAAFAKLSEFSTIRQLFALLRGQDELRACVHLQLEGRQDQRSDPRQLRHIVHCGAVHR